MQLLSQTKGVQINLDNWFDAFRKMDRDNLSRVEISVKTRVMREAVTYVFTLANPVPGVWFVHAFTLEGSPVGSASFDEFDR